MTSLETERLTIRNFKISDWEALHEMINQYQSSEFAAYDHPWPTSPEKIKEITEWFASGENYFAVCLKDTDQFVGFVCLNPEKKEDCQEFNIGYIFNFNYHGNGYATEACRVAVDYAFKQLHAQRVLTGTAAANRPSCRLLERLGFRIMNDCVALLDEKSIEFPGCKYAISKDEWIVLSK